MFRLRQFVDVHGPGRIREPIVQSEDGRKRRADWSTPSKSRKRLGLHSLRRGHLAGVAENQQPRAGACHFCLFGAAAGILARRARNIDYIIVLVCRTDARPMPMITAAARMVVFMCNLLFEGALVGP